MVKHWSRPAYVIFMVLFIAVLCASFLPMQWTGDSGIEVAYAQSEPPLGEVVAKRTQDSKTFYIGDGKYQVEISSVPVHYKDNYADNSEQWKDIDTTWRNGRIDAAPYTAWIDGLTLHYTDKQSGESGTIALEKIGTSLVDAQAQFDYQGRKALIKDFAEDLDLCVEAHPSGIKYSRIAKADKAITEAQFDIKGNLNITSQGYDADGNVLQLAASTKDGKLSEIVTSLEVDDSMGGKKTAKFPLRIDPSVEIQPNTIGCFLRKSNPTYNYTTGTDLLNGSVDTRRALYLFNTSSIPAGAILSSGVFSSYYYTYSQVNPSGLEVRTYRCARTDWEEGTQWDGVDDACWNNYKDGAAWTSPGGDMGAEYAATVFPGSVNAWMNWTITGIVEDAIQNRGNLLSLLMKFTDETKSVATQSLAVFYSRTYAVDPSLCPKLVVVYTLPDISNTPSSKDFGIVQPSSTYWAKGGTSAPSWPLADGNCTGNVTNNSAFSVDILFSMGNLTGGTQWTIGASPGNNTFTMKVCVSGAAGIGNCTVLSGTPQELITELVASASEYWEIVLYTPTNDPFDDGTAKTGNITLSAEAS